MTLVKVGDRILNLAAIDYAQWVESDRIWCIINGSPISIDGSDAHLIWGLLENRISQSISKKKEVWAIANADNFLINKVGFLEMACTDPMLFPSEKEAAYWMQLQGIKDPLKILPWGF